MAAFAVLVFVLVLCGLRVGEQLSTASALDAPAIDSACGPDGTCQERDATRVRLPALYYAQHLEGAEGVSTEDNEPKTWVQLPAAIKWHDDTVRADEAADVLGGQREDPDLLAEPRFPRLRVSQSQTGASIETRCKACGI